MGNWSINDEQRMVIRLSELAVSVMEEDNLNFATKSPSDFLCKIFDNYHQQSTASIGRFLLSQSEQLYTVLGEQTSPSIIAALRNHKEAELLAAQSGIEKGEVPINVRLQNKTVCKLLECEALEGKYYSWPRLYMQAVLEEYFRLQSTQRERVYFAPRFDTIQTAISEQRQLRITLRSGSTFLVHPCLLQKDKLNSRWYLACYSRPLGRPISEKRPASFRISHITEVEILRDKAVISAQHRKELMQRINTQGIQFLTEDSRHILVRMTPKGVRSYGDIMTMRPTCQSKNGDVWEFNCTRLQALRYFCRMASECEILEPKSLRKDMIKLLSSGIKTYNGNE